MAKIKSIYTKKLGRVVARKAKGTVGKYHVIPAQTNRWNVVLEGKVTPFKKFNTMTSAVTFAKQYASAVNFGEVVVHSIEGKILDKISY